MLAHNGVTMLPEQLKTLLDVELVAYTHKYFRAMLERDGYL